MTNIFHLLLTIREHVDIEKELFWIINLDSKRDEFVIKSEPNSVVVS